MTKSLKLLNVYLLLTFLMSINVYSQNRTSVEGVILTGTVKDSISQKPIKDVSITVSGSEKKTVTNNEGFYRLILYSKPDSIFFHHKKYSTKRMALKILNNDVGLRYKRHCILKKG